MADPAVSDAALRRALNTYAGMVGHVLTDPERWLGQDTDPGPEAGRVRRVLDAVRDKTFGEVTPASPQWSQQPLKKRVDWWVKRIGVSAGLAAAAPRFAGALADRVPLQAALGASAAGLAVCAVAREHGAVMPSAWVPLLAKVLFDRDLGAEAESVPSAQESESQLADADDDGHRGGVTGLVQSAARTLWRLARAFLGIGDLLDERPRGGLLARVAGKLPVIGVAGGWLDERGGIRRAAKETAELVR